LPAPAISPPWPPIWSRKSKLSGDFHLLLARIVGNATLTGYLIELVARSSLVLAVYDGAVDQACWLDEHRHIADALAQRDAEGAARQVEAHLTEVEARLRLDDEAHRPQVDVKAIFGL
jgi:DNA-binding GntR family transcriptional regulator